MIKLLDRYSPDEGDVIKKTIKEIVECGRQLEVLQVKCCAIPELFSQELIEKRTRIRDTCIQILLEFPKIYGRIVREKLWRYVYYDVIQKARRIQKDNEQGGIPLAYISQYVLNGVGHLNLVLAKLAELPECSRSKFMLKIDGINNIADMKLAFTSMDDQSLVEPPKWLVDLIYIITINLGDMYRYLTEFHTNFNEDESLVYFNRAKDYYSQAFILYPDSGLSQNQIGNLSVRQNGGVDTVYYMLHSMLSKIAYEGAASNLRQHLSTVVVNFARLPASTEAQPMEVFCNLFMMQIHNFLYETVNIVKFGKTIVDLMTNFQERLATYNPDLDESLLFRISSICVLTFWQLQAQNSPNISLAVAFATAIFSQLITQLGTILEHHSHLQKEELLSISPILSVHNGDDNEVSGLNFKISNLKFETEDNGQIQKVVQQPKSEQTCVVKKKKSYLAYRRRPRTGKNMSGSGTDEDEGEHSDGSYDDTEEKQNSDDHFYTTDEEDSDDSEEEESEYENDNELADTGIDVPVKHKVTNGNVRAFNSASSSNCQSDTSGNSVNLNGGEKISREEPPMLEFECEKNSHENVDNEGGTTGPEKYVIGLEELQKCWSQLEPLLVAMLPFIRWLQISPEIKDAFSANCGKEYVTKMCEMFNLLGSQNWSKIMQGVDLKLKEDWKLLSNPERGDVKLFQTQLPEDRSMLGIPQYQEFVNDLRIENALNKNELLVTRIGRVLLFGHWLVETKSFSMMFDSDEKLFILANPKLLKRRDQNTKLKKFMDGINSNPSCDALTKAYKASGENYRSQQRRGKDRRDRNGKGRRRERRRHGHGNGTDMYAQERVQVLKERKKFVQSLYSRLVEKDERGIGVLEDK